MWQEQLLSTVKKVHLRPSSDRAENEFTPSHPFWSSGQMTKRRREYLRGTGERIHLSRQGTALVNARLRQGRASTYSYFSPSVSFSFLQRSSKKSLNYANSPPEIVLRCGLRCRDPLFDSYSPTSTHQHRLPQRPLQHPPTMEQNNEQDDFHTSPTTTTPSFHPSWPRTLSARSKHLPDQRGSRTLQKDRVVVVPMAEIFTMVLEDELKCAQLSRLNPASVISNFNQI
ncbi:uncharacterized protein [Misgurnus anguillicaudatus]|uniref:uncharacterized protein n=1 Tax=Misgurnus anguillicaudatus TaxID=75329 RepID=UPI003CCFBB7F